MTDSGRSMSECEHGKRRDGCPECRVATLAEEVERLRAVLDHYESVLCAPDALLRRLESGHDGREISRTRVVELVRELDRLTSGMTCFGCGVKYSLDIARERCPEAHRDNWPHEWVSRRVLDLTEKCADHLNEVERLRANQDSVPCPSCVDGIAGADYYGESVDCDLCGGTGRITGEMVKSLQSRLDDFVGRRMEADAENEQLRRERDAAMWHLIREWPVSGISVCLRSGYESDMRWVTSREAAVEAVVESHRKAMP